MIKERLAHDCQRCGWKRYAGTGPEWARRILEHPVYGPTSNAKLVHLDIRDHNCRDHLEAGYRAEIRRNGRPHRNYYRPIYDKENSNAVEAES